jgi:hypothetical protein
MPQFLPSQKPNTSNRNLIIGATGAGVLALGLLFTGAVGASATGSQGQSSTEAVIADAASGGKLASGLIAALDGAGSDQTRIVKVTDGASRVTIRWNVSGNTWEAIDNDIRVLLAEIHQQGVAKNVHLIAVDPAESAKHGASVVLANVWFGPEGVRVVAEDAPTNVLSVALNQANTPSWTVFNLPIGPRTAVATDTSIASRGISLKVLLGR